MDNIGEETLRSYRQRINRVIDYINERLPENPTLDELAAAAPFSKFHFHRVFRALVGEPVHAFIQRLRLEKAAHMLIFDRRKTVTAVALDCGFSSSQNFAKAFRAHFGETPARFRANHDFRDFASLFRKNGNIFSKNGEAPAGAGAYNDAMPDGTRAGDIFLEQRRYAEMKVEVKELPPMHVAYARHIGKYGPEGIGPAFQKLMGWAGPRGICGPGTMVLGVSWDNPQITPDDMCRYDACMTVPEGTAVEGEIGLQTIPGGRFAVYRAEVLDNDFEKPWTELMRDWLPMSGFQPADQPCYELYHNDAASDPEHKWIVDLCLPVKPI